MGTGSILLCESDLRREPCGSYAALYKRAVRENSFKRSAFVFSHRNKLCIERHLLPLGAAAIRTRTIICCRFQSTLILSCLAYAFGMLQGGLLICDWGGYEMWWDKKSILLIPLACCKMDFFYFVPVEPKPPSPLSVSSSSSTSLNDAVMYGAKTI